MEGVYKQTVSVEKVAFNEADKKDLKAGKKGLQSDVRINSDGVFTTFLSVNNQHTQVEEGQYIITFADGSQKLLTEKDAKDNLSISSKKDSVDTDQAKVILNTTDGTQTILNEEQSAELLKEDNSKPGKKK